MKNRSSQNSAAAQSAAFMGYLLLTAMVSGAMVMVIEVLGSRVIGPFFGVSLFVWTSLISVAMMALALGYALGGILSDRHNSADWLYLIIFVAGVLVYVIPWFKADVITLSIPLGLRGGSFVSSLILFGPSLFLLGCVSPFLVKIATAGMRNLGRTVGGFYAVSTLGSVVGTVLTGFVLIAWLGVDRIFTLVGTILMGLAFFYFIVFRRRYVYTAAMLSLFFLPSPPGHSNATVVLSNGTRMALIDSRDSNYGSLKVVDYIGDRFQVRELMIDGLIQGGIDRSTGASTYEYAYYLQFLPFSIHPTGTDALIIGLGAGVMPMWYERKGIVTDVVDIDPVVVEMARKYFGFRLQGDLYVGDARYFLGTSRKSYDYLILDVFNGDTTPAHLLIIEALKLMAARLMPMGVLGINLAGSLEIKPFMTASIILTLRQVFSQVEVYPVFDRDKSFGNLAVIAYQGEVRRKALNTIKNEQVHPLAESTVNANLLRRVEPSTLEQPIVLTDDYNPVDFFDTWFREQVRREIMQADYQQLLYGS